MRELGRFLILTGIALVVAGLVLSSGFGRGWLGRLPGDIRIEKGNFSFYFPLATCLLLSFLLTVALWIYRLFLRR
ncbi:putative Uncharacterized membrane protein YrzS [Candidatus Methylacidithermus pantelleriae]|uniref:Putative Uncharacterized membrane protein YrzS n=1 Tax=Candidatus Methylacidithermus pantelleriae TaxID=2744239 RepID=A0A8J2BRW5_9BACT|nr:putative Uncharacterized membrane protein YrzS [Candidatus Methylacidithermus pantelleriae]